MNSPEIKSKNLPLICREQSLTANLPNGYSSCLKVTAYGSSYSKSLDPMVLSCNILTCKILNCHTESLSLDWI